MKFNDIYNKLINENFILNNQTHNHLSYIIEPKLDNKTIDELLEKGKKIYKQYITTEDTFNKNKHIYLSLIDGNHFKEVIQILKHIKTQDIRDFESYAHEYRPIINYDLKSCYLAQRDNRKTFFIDIINQEDIQNYIKKLKTYIKSNYKVNIPDYKDRYYYLNIASSGEPINNINNSDKSLYDKLIKDTNRENLIRHLKIVPKIKSI